MVSGTMRTLYISDEAYDELIQQARTSGYVRGYWHAKGLAKYVEHLMTCNMEDARPEDVKASDADMLSVGHAPDWRLYSPRKRRGLKLSDAAMIAASIHCLKLNMAHGNDRKLTGAPIYSDSDKCMSVLLEAIGTEWVKVTHEPDQH